MGKISINQIIIQINIKLPLINTANEVCGTIRADKREIGHKQGDKGGLAWRRDN